MTVLRGIARTGRTVENNVVRTREAIFNPAFKVFRTVAGVGKVADSVLKKTEVVPVIGEFTKEARQSDIYKETMGVFDTGLKLIDLFERSSKIADKIVNTELDLLEKADEKLEQGRPGKGTYAGTGLFGSGRAMTIGRTAGLRR